MQAYESKNLRTQPPDRYRGGQSIPAGLRRIYHQFSQEPSKLHTARDSSADMILLDNGYGTGETFDWTLVRDIGRPFILAGGLREENIQDAANMQPDTMDISSGAETNRVKDPEKIRTLINIIRSI